MDGVDTAKDLSVDKTGKYSLDVSANTGVTLSVVSGVFLADPASIHVKVKGKPSFTYSHLYN